MKITEELIQQMGFEKRGLNSFCLTLNDGKEYRLLTRGKNNGWVFFSPKNELHIIFDVRDLFDRIRIDGIHVGEESKKDHIKNLFLQVIE